MTFTIGRKPCPKEWDPARGCRAEPPVEPKSALVRRSFAPMHQRWVSFLVSSCLETPAEAAPMPVLSAAEGPPDAGRGSPAR